MIFEICAIIVTVLFAILTIFIVIALRSVQESMKTSKHAIEHLTFEITEVKDDLHHLLTESITAAEKINVRLNDFDPLLETIGSVGRTLRNAAQAFEARSTTPSWAESEYNKTRWQENVADILELTGMGMKVFKQFQKRR